MMNSVCKLKDSHKQRVTGITETRELFEGHTLESHSSHIKPVSRIANQIFPLFIKKYLINLNLLFHKFEFKANSFSKVSENH